MTLHLAYVALGSNLHNPPYQVSNALKALAILPYTQLRTHSSLYRTAPWGPQNQPAYINAVALLQTHLAVQVLLNHLQTIERNHGRVRTVRWGPRTLDLDLLLYDNRQLKSPILTLPHPGLYQRAFVLYPLYECAPTLVLPTGQPLSELIQSYSAAGLQQLKTKNTYKSLKN